MAATVNARDVLISGGTRTQAVTLPSDVNVSGNVTGTLNGTPVTTVVTGADRAFNALDVNGEYIKSLTSTKLTVVGSNPSTGWVGDANGIRMYQGGSLKVNIPVSGAPSFSGDITGGSNINITGSGAFNGFTSTAVGNAAIAANTSDSAVHGVYARSTGVRTGVFGFNSGTGTGIQGTNTGGGIGVFGSASGVSGSKGGEFVGSGNGITALKAGKVSGSGNALEVVGPMTISSTTLVSNLNAQYWNSASLQMNAAAGSSTAVFNNTTKPGTNSGGNGWMIITYGGTKYAIPTWVVTP